MIARFVLTFKILIKRMLTLLLKRIHLFLLVKVKNKTDIKMSKTICDFSRLTCPVNGAYNTQKTISPAEGYDYHKKVCPGGEGLVLVSRVRLHCGYLLIHSDSKW